MVKLLVGDLILSNDIFIGKKKYFMISESRQKYIKLTEEQYFFYSNIIQIINDAVDEDELESKIFDYTHGKIQLRQINEVMSKYNLLSETIIEEKVKIESDLSSLKLKEIPLDKFQEQFSRVFYYTWRIVQWVLLILIVWIIGLLIFKNSMVMEAFKIPIEQIQGNNRLEYNILVILFGTFFALLGHEIGHLLSANYNSVKWKSINFLMKWGVRFSCYIRYKNFYMYPSAVKMRILLSGVYMNFFQACIWFLLFIYLKEMKYIILTIMNLLCVMNNVLPQGTSDGYHLFCILLGLEGVRWKMLKLVSNIIISPKKVIDLIKKKENVYLLIYFATSYILSIFGCYVLLKNLLQYLNIIGNDVYKNGLAVVVIVIILGVVTMNVKKFITNLKSL